jgi:hypothetical protein
LGDSQDAVALEDIKGVIASSAGYSKDAIELLASPAHLRVSISDDKLAHNAAPKDGSDSAHTEDILEFRKGPNQRFSHHIT